MENLPAKAILLRTIHMIYRGNPQLEQFLTMEKLMEHYGLTEYKELFGKFASKFLNELRNDRELSAYHKTHRRDMGVIHSNRQRMNYSADEYERLFRDIFRGTEGRQIYLFGSGNFTKKFLSRFGANYDIAGILDNNREKWGSELSGIPIMAHIRLLFVLRISFRLCVRLRNWALRILEYLMII